MELISVNYMPITTKIIINGVSFNINEQSKINSFNRKLDIAWNKEISKNKKKK